METKKIVNLAKILCLLAQVLCVHGIRKQATALAGLTFLNIRVYFLGNLLEEDQCQIA